MTDGRRAGIRGEGAEPPSMEVLAADSKSGAAGGRGTRTLRAGPGVRRGGKELAQTQGADRQRDTQTRELTVAGTHGPAGRRAAAGAHLAAAAAAAAPAAGRLSPRSGPLSWRPAGRPVQAPLKRRRRRSRRLLSGGDAAAPTDSRPLGSARPYSETLGSARSRSARLGAWPEAPRPSRLWRRWAGLPCEREPPDVPESGPCPGRMRGLRSGSAPRGT